MNSQIKALKERFPGSFGALAIGGLYVLADSLGDRLSPTGFLCRQCGNVEFETCHRCLRVNICLHCNKHPICTHCHIDIVSVANSLKTKRDIRDDIDNYDWDCYSAGLDHLDNRRLRAKLVAKRYKDIYGK